MSLSNLIVPYLVLAISVPWVTSVVLESLPVKISERQGFYKGPLEQKVYFFEALHEIPLTFDRSNWIKNIKSNILNRESIVEKFTDPVFITATRHIFEMDIRMLEELNRESNNVTRESLTEQVYQYYRHLEVRSCEHGLLSFYSIAPALLSERLDELEKELRVKNLELSFPHRQNYSHYYLQPLVQCEVSGEDLLIKLQVPVKSIGNDYSIEQLTLVPFMKQGEICVLAAGANPALTHLVTRNRNERFLTTYNSQSDSEGVVCTNSLCLIRDGAEPEKLDPCLETLLNAKEGDKSSLADICPAFHCQQIENEVIFVWPTANFTLITSSQTDVNISCQHQGTEALQWTVKPPKIGTVQIVNSCKNCIVTVGSTILRHSADAEHCDPGMIVKELQVFNVIPSAMKQLLVQETKAEPSMDPLVSVKTEL